ncbi:DUF1289 domain-containing protein [Pandoraea nosoerga]|uniref:DUF1289 domain-containing protein n=1 Tax=Pandoraea nosoerga TaxID=2508296 RepID=A0A5E4RXG2_9BURK|nr:DUF1289 domain-containing protein [Pandoraea nosoerga]MBN4667663.1 DUF1289 domain-containing protein [Pandoraea nosoerga]MBN4674258.1 DUF1289 domain-containing protein [Pandoraea nosoerga]MBN4679527.1 DUF1289 domain-containing protein [Pandoraea nosoerga]MBN4743384.1 DUF1289 domain-containing protein [Pandoraea nosoerga]VVD67967.1 hypothetical protein PNO31109_00446 [Pandoraea nosoerga]
MTSPSPPCARAASPVPSPCINVCRMNPGTGWCSGCWRTLAEIAAWSAMSDDDKRRVWSLLPGRREANAEPPATHRRVRADDAGADDAGANGP